MHKLFALLPFVFIFSFSVLAQPINNLIKDVSMPPPNAASLGKFGEIPVGYYTGVPNISIPIHTVIDGPLSLPVSLNYHAGGVRVGEPAGWVGLGWTLQAGGMISRTVQGKADESCDGFFMSAGKIKVSATEVVQQNKKDTLVCVEVSAPYNVAGVQSGTVDSEPDLFSFSIGGFSGKFFIGADLTNDNVINGPVILVPKQDVGISYETSGSCGTFQIRKFVITTPDGVRYEFGNIDNSAENKGIDVQQFNEIPFPTVTGWQLRRISSADGNYAVNLDYVQEKYRYPYRSSGNAVFTPNLSAIYPAVSPSGGYTHHVIDILGWRLSTITTTGNLSKVSFLPAAAAREDLTVSTWNVGNNPDAARALAAIKIESGTLCKQFDLTQTYYTDNSADKSGTAADKRLKLNSVQEHSCDNSILGRPYTFLYHEQPGNPSFMPNRLSSSVDHWGFYNGAANPHTGMNIPVTKLPSYVVGGQNVYPIKGTSNRETDGDKMKWGTISQLVYPTGGYTSFEFEANTYYGSRDIYTYSDVAELKRPQGGDVCSNDVQPVQTINMGVLTANDLENLYYTWTNEVPPAQNPACQGASPNVTVQLFQTGAVQPIFSAAALVSNVPGSTQTAEGKLKELFMNKIPLGVAVSFKIQGINVLSHFYIKKLSVTTENKNLAVGGLRLKKITSHDGSVQGQDVVKSYTYDKAVIPGQSSGILYAKPTYGTTFNSCLGGCALKNWNEIACPLPSSFVATHFFFETSVVPLASLEGYHIGYSAVREYFDGAGSGFYNLYQYYNDPEVLYFGLPQVPQLPRIGSGELESKASRTANNQDIAYDIYTKKPEVTDLLPGTYIKWNSYHAGGEPNGTPITFWKTYPLATRPFRYQEITSFRDGQTTITSRQYAGNGHLQLTRETLTNSDGKVTETEYKYPADLAGLPAAQLSAFNNLYFLTPLETNVKVGGAQQKCTKTEYAFFDNASGSFSSTSVAGASAFIRPYQFKTYENGWVQKGQIDSYHGTASASGRAGLPKQFTKTGWQTEIYEWTPAGQIKKRTFGSFNWQYEYLAGTGFVTKITNPDGQFSEFSYDKLMRTGQINERGGNVVTAYSYTYPTVDASGNITTFGHVKSTKTYSAVAGSGLASQESYQYIDGLGRNIETVFKGKATGGKDQVMAVSYDNQGNVSKSFEPFASAVSDGSYQSPGASAFTLTEYEANPLHRMSKVNPPSWAATNTTYGTNSAADGVLNYNFSNGTSASFAADALTKTAVTDGNSNKTISFTDKKGRLLLSRRANNNETGKADTYYVYDDKDRLVRVLPPGAGWNDAELVFTYQYTPGDLVSQKKVPGKAYEAFEYNSRDLPVRYQDPFLRTNGNLWMGTKYDAYGRLTEKGVYSSGSGDAIVLTNKVIENVYGTSGIEIDKLKTTKVQAFTQADPVVTPNAANAVLQTTFEYDAFGRIKNSTGNNHLSEANLAAETVNYVYDHGDNILTETRTSVHSGGTTNIVNSRLFDAWGRPTQTSQNLNGAGEKIISQLSYTDKSQLACKKLGGGLQQIDYGYLPNGLLSNINGSAAWAGSNFGVSNMLANFNMPTFSGNNNGDLFREVLEYNTLTSGLGGSAQNSGNIGQMIWQVRGRTTEAYGFTYDYLDRLTSAKFSNYNPGGDIDATDYFGESQAFDTRGNITGINRKGLIKGASKYTFGTIDNQVISQQAGTNLSVQSTGKNSIPPATAGMTVPHNHLNLPARFDFGGNNSIELLYDALGNKLRKTVKTNNVVALTQDYLDGIELKNNVVEAVYNEEGRAFNNAGTFRYEYALKDHLGNTRVVFTDKGAAGIQDQTEILSEAHYYPFGKSFDGAWYTDATSPKYRYLYNSKELNEDFQLNFYDFGARWYDPGMGSWWEVDPLGEMFESLSPYNYAENNPITNVDPDGMSSFGVNGSLEYETLRRGAGFGGMDMQAIGACPSCPKDKSYDIYRDSKELFTYDKKTASVYNSKGDLAEQAVRPTEGTTIGLPWWYSLGTVAENIPQIGLNGLKAASTIPLMTLALVLSPTPAGEGSTVDQFVLNSKPTPEKNPGEFKRLPGNQGWVHKKTGEIYKKSHTSHGNPGNVGTQWKVWPKGTTDFGSNSKKSGERTTLDGNGNIIGN